MALYASWVHGTAFQPAEYPGSGLSNVNNVDWTDKLGFRQGWGTTWKGQAGHGNFFHVSIPTPVIVNGTRARLTKVYVMFMCGDLTVNNALHAGANVTAYHIWDGPNRIHLESGMLLFGEHRNFLDTSNTIVLSAPIEIYWGLGISVQVQFTNDQFVSFASAGADFEI